VTEMRNSNLGLVRKISMNNDKNKIMIAEEKRKGNMLFKVDIVKKNYKLFGMMITYAIKICKLKSPTMNSS
jgi:hypothetical protein